MPRRKAKGINPADIQPVEPVVTLPRAAFKALHSAGRALFKQIVQTDSHSREALVYLQLLDAAIDEGHRALGTQRSYADEYIHLVEGLTQVQMHNAQKILEHEGLLPLVPQPDSL